jgi:hypothetical protein
MYVMASRTTGSSHFFLQRAISPAEWMAMKPLAHDTAEIARLTGITRLTVSELAVPMDTETRDTLLKIPTLNPPVHARSVVSVTVAPMSVRAAAGATIGGALFVSAGAFVGASLEPVVPVPTISRPAALLPAAQPITFSPSPSIPTTIVKQALSSPTVGLKPTGYANTDNRCFFIAVLSVLRSMPAFWADVQKAIQISNSTYAGASHVLYVSVLKGLVEEAKSSHTSTDVKKLMDIFVHGFDAFALRRHAPNQDAQIDCTEVFHAITHALMTFVPESCFTGVFATTTTCLSCPEPVPSTTTHATYEINLPSVNRSLPTQAQLDNVALPTSDERMVDCASCNPCSVSGCIKCANGEDHALPRLKTCLESYQGAPKVLVVCRNLFASSDNQPMVKLMDVANTTVDSSIMWNGSQYRLTSVISHIGNSPHSGHYIADVAIGNVWWRMDDTRVLRCGDTRLEKEFGWLETPYMLFYERVTDAGSAAVL